jgi:multimeric flavodoxin WrbA
MKIAICNGSPKGERSITLQYVKYLMNTHGEVKFTIHHVAREIKKLENNPDYFRETIDSLEQADAVIWSFGLWVLSVPAQFMRFFELIQERGCGERLKGKYAGILSTSVHYFDHSAHEYLRGVSEDLGMMVADAISFHMRDLTKSEQRKNLKHFADTIVHAVKNDCIFPNRYQPFDFGSFEYMPVDSKRKISTHGKRVLVLSDSSNPGSNLGKMIGRFQDSFSEEIECIDLNSIDIKGACNGCMKCGYDYLCVYKDGFKDFYNDSVRSADIIVHAGEMKGRYLSSLWKTFFDRAFFWNHTPSLEGKQFAYLISGPISQNANLIQILEAHASARQHANHAGIISDEVKDSARIDNQIQSLAERLICNAENDYVKPEDFLGIGGWKIIRDEIYAGIRMVWQADHRHFKKNGYYDFPNKNKLVTCAMDFISILLKIPGFRKKFYSKLNEMPAKKMGLLAEQAK